MLRSIILTGDSTSHGGKVLAGVMAPNLISS